jgi:hypothetical protein
MPSARLHVRSNTLVGDNRISRLVSEDIVDVDFNEFCGEIVQLKVPGASKPYPYAVWVCTACGPIVWIVSRNARDTYYVEGRAIFGVSASNGKNT